MATKASNTIHCPPIRDFITTIYPSWRSRKPGVKMLAEDAHKGRTLMLVFASFQQKELEFMKANLKKFKIVFESEGCINKNYKESPRSNVLVILDWID